MEAVSSAQRPEFAGVTVPEIGSRCRAFSVEQLDKLAQQHIAQNTMNAFDKIEFGKQIAGYWDVLARLENPQLAWRRKNSN